jgi:hypothetical protein
VDVVEVEGLQIEDGGLERAQTLLDDVVTCGEVVVEVGEAACPLRILVLEVAAEFILRLRDLIEDQLQLRIHGSPGSLVAREVLVWRIGG